MSVWTPRNGKSRYALRTRGNGRADRESAWASGIVLFERRSGTGSFILRGLRKEYPDNRDVVSNGRQKRKDPTQSYLSGVIKPATTYFRAMHYHRLQGLNYCDRDGNRCDSLDMVTDKERSTLSSVPNECSDSSG